MRNISIQALRLLCLMLASVVTLVACQQTRDTKIIRMAHGLDVTHPVHHAIKHMDEQLRVLSGGTMQIDIYPSGQLGSERELIELLQIGSLGMTKVSASPLESFVPEMKIFSIPYVFNDNEHLWRVLNGSIGKGLLAATQKYRIRGMAYYDAGSRSFYSCKKPIYTPEDLAGMKIRVQKSQTSIDMVAALGGSATPISWGELYTALQQGVVDGAENNPPSFHLSKHYEVCKYYTIDEHTSVPDVILLSNVVWEALSAQEQKWLQQAVDASVIYQRERWKAATQEAMRAVQNAGVEVIYPDKLLFQQKVVGLHQGYQDTKIGALLSAIKSEGEIQ
ncbi:MAG: TRAP transporter substrate-binding protein [Robiginitomaculum sp.]|nr:TRAP transporter substrate-binding protein [Robiginitomaculum sp.]